MQAIPPPPLGRILTKLPSHAVNHAHSSSWQVKKELLPSVITPLKTPPAHFFPSFSHIASNFDESANLSPAKPHKTSTLTHSMSSAKQEGNSLGFMAASLSRPPPESSSHPQGITELAVATASAALNKFNADSSSSESSGEESDSESSDSEVEEAPPQSDSVTSVGMPILEVDYDDIARAQPKDSAWEKEIVSENVFPIIGETGMDAERSSASAKVHDAREGTEQSRHPGRESIALCSCGDLLGSYHPHFKILFLH